MAMKATKFGSFIKTLANADVNALLAKIDAEAAKKQAELADFPQAMGVICKVTGQVMKHQADTFCIVAEGLQDISSSLREPDNDAPAGRDSNTGAWTEGPDLQDHKADQGKHYLIGRDRNDQPVFYGPGSKDFCLEILTSCSESNLDLAGQTAATKSGNIRPLHQIPDLCDGSLLERAAWLDQEFTRG